MQSLFVFLDNHAGFLVQRNSFTSVWSISKGSYHVVLVPVPTMRLLPRAIRGLGSMERHWSMPSWQWKLILETVM